MKGDLPMKDQKATDEQTVPFQLSLPGILEQVEILKGIAFALALFSQGRRIEPSAVYTMHEASWLASCAYQSIFHAIKNKHLKAGGIGRTPRVKGSDLLDWIEAGGRTGRRGKAPD